MFDLAHSRRAQELDMRRAISARTGFQRSYVLAGACLAAIASVGLSFGGTAYSLERDGGAVFSTLGSALCVSIVTGVFQFVGWWVLLETGSYIGFFRKLGGTLCAVAFLFYSYGTSSYFNYAKLTAASATIMYLDDQVHERTAILDGLRAKADAVNQLRPAVLGERDAACNARTLEEEQGAFSGSRGIGYVYAVLTSICDRANAAVGSLDAAIGINAENAARAREILDSIERSLSDVDTPILPRERNVRSLIRELDDIIRDVRSARMTESIEAFFGALVSSVTALNSGEGNSLAARQNRALANLRAGFEERLPMMQRLIADVSQAPVADIRLDNRPSVHEMMLHSVGKHPQNVLLALGIDSFAAFMILALLLKEPPLKPSRPRSRKK